jgi:hypothetical protein
MFACKECAFQIDDLGLLRLHMIHMHGAHTNWPGPPPLQLTHAEAQELYAYLLDAYLNPNEYPHLRKLLARIDSHLGMRDEALTA